MTLSVVIPTYQRPEYLTRAVESVLSGSIRPEEIVIAHRPDDQQTGQAVASLMDGAGRDLIRLTEVLQPGFVIAVAAGMRAATGDIVAIIDDDVTVAPSWLEMIQGCFGDPDIGVVGGRAVIPGWGFRKWKGRPGRITWYGKHWGNLASVDGPHAFEVAAVQECNWAWRRELLRSIEFSETLNFDDAIMYGLDLCLQARARGFRVVYEPRAVVHHHLAPRSRELDRADRLPRLYAYCRNYTYVMLRRLPWPQKVAFLGWWFLIGERNAWGPGAALADSLLHGLRWRGEAGVALRGKIQGLALALRHNE